MDFALDLIFSRLGARDVARAACVSTTFRRAADRAPIRLAVTPRTVSAITQWIARRHRIARIVSIACASACILPSPQFAHLDALKITGCRVCMRDLLSRVPKTLSSLVVRRLTNAQTLRRPPYVATATFSTQTMFGAFSRLRILRLGFVPHMLGRIGVDGGPALLEILDLRGCPDVFVDGRAIPPRLRELSVVAPDGGVYVTRPIRGHMDLFAIDGVNRGLSTRMIPDSATVVDLRLPNADVSGDVYDKLRRAERVKLVVAFIVLDAPPPPFFTVETQRLAVDDLAFVPTVGTHVRVAGVPFNFGIRVV